MLQATGVGRATARPAPTLPAFNDEPHTRQQRENRGRELWQVHTRYIAGLPQVNRPAAPKRCAPLNATATTTNAMTSGLQKLPRQSDRQLGWEDRSHAGGA
jgi:hypothetical protein